jgi:hypothetical protein
MLLQACIPAIWEAEAGESLEPRQYSRTPSLKKSRKKKRHKHAAFLRLGLPEQYKGKERRVFKIPKKP